MPIRAALGFSSLLLVSFAAACTPVSTNVADPEPKTDAVATSEPTGGDNEYTMAYGDQTIVVHADPTLAVEVARLFALFEDLASEQVPIDHNTRLPIGWTTLSFAVEGERLVVQEPDYTKHAERYTRSDITVSLATLARQRGVLENAGVAGESINFDQHVLIIRGSLELDEVFLLRVVSPGARLTGWRLSPTAGIEEGAETESVPVYEVLAARPALLDAMLLPPGYMAFYSGDTLTTVVDGNDQVVWDWTFAPDELERDEPTQPTLQPLD